ncbi:hypothetical protein FACS1894180_0890 [Bacteroidia bacterium]|nr:hypothetical protein FACS1894180_0890 [Bacteroidia bacterium]
MKTIFFTFFTIILFMSCSDKKIIENIYSSKIELEEIFENVSVCTRGNAVIVDLYKDSLINHYVFEDRSSIFSKDSFVFITDTIQFDVKELNKGYLTNIEDVEYCAKYYLRKIKQYQILSVTSEVKKFGITCQFRGANFVVYYVKDIDSINNKYWLKGIKESNKLDANWYYEYLENESN